MYISVPASFWLASTSFAKMVLNSSRRAGTTRIATWTTTFGILFAEGQRSAPIFNKTRDKGEGSSCIVDAAQAAAEHTGYQFMSSDHRSLVGRAERPKI
jgi:hypothetical protein